MVEFLLPFTGCRKVFGKKPGNILGGASRWFGKKSREMENFFTIKLLAMFCEILPRSYEFLTFCL